MMRPADLLAFATRRPFEPFRVHLTDGTVYQINHPELVMAGERTAIIGVPADPADRHFERYETVALAHIVKIVPEAAPASPGNGATPSVGT